MTAKTKTRLGLLAAITATAALLLASAAPASASGPAWRLDTLADTTAAPGGGLTYIVRGANVGDAPADGSVEPIVFTGSFPAGLTGKSVVAGGFSCHAGDGVSPVDGASAIKCTSTGFVGTCCPRTIDVTVAVDSGASGVLTTSFGLSGGGAPAVSTVDPTLITEAAPAFGIDAFDGNIGADPGANPYTQAGGHPYDLSTAVDFSTRENQTLNEIYPNQGFGYPVEPLKDLVADVPPGVLGNPTVAATCTAADLANGESISSQPLCSSDSQVGTILLRVDFEGIPKIGPVPVFNMAPVPGVPARFGFAVLGTIQTIDAHLRTDGSYGLAVGSRNVGEGIGLAGFTTDFWGVPSDESHRSERGCPGKTEPYERGPTCPSSLAEPLPFLRNTTACTAKADEGLPWSAHADSWFHPGATMPEGYPDLSDSDWKNSGYLSHEAPGYPASPEDPSTPWGKQVGVSGCEEVPFEPSFEATPTSNAADSPTGLEVDLAVPQECWEEVQSICPSDLKKAVVKLPEGMSVNPSSAAGLEACSSAQIGLLGSHFAGINPIHFTGTPDSCPEDSRIGTVKIETPLLEEPVAGSVYLAKQGDNPFNSLLALYIVANDPQSGVLLKLAGRVIVNEKTAQLETVFDDNPQLPFSHLHLALKSGPRAALITPPTCGKYSTEATLGPWSGTEAAHLESPFEITSGPSGQPCPPVPAAFNPKLSAGTKNPLAGTYSPFSLRITREDGTQRLAGVKLAVPPGLLADLKGIPYCPDSALDAIPSAEGTAAAALANPPCPAASAIGTVIAGAGAGPNPFYVQTGKAYWAGPYKGAPVSLAILTPALAGPFDLGNVVVRTGFEVDPETARITAVSDPLPTALHGIPLDLRDVRVALDRPHYTLNPTSCDPMAFEGTLSGTEGATANVSDRFQVGNCGALGFKPKLGLSLKGATKRTGHPALRAVLTMPEGGANVARAQVTLPHSEFIDQGHIKTICTRVQFAAGGGGGEQCPPGSIYGYARAYSPILDYYLRGPVYLRSSSHQLPDLVVSLGGQIHVDVVGRIDSFHRGIRTTFEAVPDAPVSKFVLEMQGAKKGLIQNSQDLCASPHRASALFDGQNGKVSDSKPLLGAKCGHKKAKAKHKHGH